MKRNKLFGAKTVRNTAALRKECLYPGLATAKRQIAKSTVRLVPDF
ncbi:hypothetical protein [Candidatus Cryosericum hinesii]|nr:hypothetical protein [Candidatus Cryosericum hinesii]